MKLYLEQSGEFSLITIERLERKLNTERNIEKLIIRICNTLPYLYQLETFILWANSNDKIYQTFFTVKLIARTSSRICLYFIRSKKALKMEFRKGNAFVENLEGNGLLAINRNSVFDFCRKWLFKRGIEYFKNVFVKSKYKENANFLQAKKLSFNGIFLSSEENFSVNTLEGETLLEEKQVDVLNRFLAETICSPPFSREAFLYFIRILHSPFSCLSALICVFDLQLRILGEKNEFSIFLGLQKEKSFEILDQTIYLSVFIKKENFRKFIPIAFDMVSKTIGFWTVLKKPKNTKSSQLKKQFVIPNIALIHRLKNSIAKINLQYCLAKSVEFLLGLKISELNELVDCLRANDRLDFVKSMLEDSSDLLKKSESSLVSIGIITEGNVNEKRFKGND